MKDMENKNKKIKKNKRERKFISLLGMHFTGDRKHFYRLLMNISYNKCGGIHYFIYNNKNIFNLKVKKKMTTYIDILYSLTFNIYPKESGLSPMVHPSQWFFPSFWILIYSYIYILHAFSFVFILSPLFRLAYCIHTSLGLRGVHGEIPWRCQLK